MTRPPRRARADVLLALAFIAAVVCPEGASAQEPAPPAATHPAEAASQDQPAGNPPAAKAAPTLEELQRQIEELKALLAVQQALIAAQKETIAKQQGDIKAQTAKLEEMQRVLESTTRRLDELQQELPSAESRKAIEDRLKRVEKTADKTPELPPNVVSAGDFPGSIRIPGTDAAVKFGRSEEHTSELQSLRHLVCRLLLEKKKKT